jgi:hypothetical protein
VVQTLQRTQIEDSIILPMGGTFSKTLLHNKFESSAFLWPDNIPFGARCGSGSGYKADNQNFNRLKS